jgi:hypothetical protein
VSGEKKRNGGAREERRPPHCCFHQSSEGLQSSSSSSEAEAEAEALQEVGIGWSGSARTRARRRRSADFFLLASLPSRDAHLTIEENSSLVGLALRGGGSGAGLDDDDDDRDARAAPRSPQKASRQTKLVPSSWLSVHYYVSCLSCTYVNLLCKFEDCFAFSRDCFYLFLLLSQQEQKREAETEVQRRRSEAHNSLRKEARAWKPAACCCSSPILPLFLFLDNAMN